MLSPNTNPYLKENCFLCEDQRNISKRGTVTHFPALSHLWKWRVLRKPFIRLRSENRSALLSSVTVIRPQGSDATKSLSNHWAKSAAKQAVSTPCCQGMTKPHLAFLKWSMSRQWTHRCSPKWPSKRFKHLPHRFFHSGYPLCSVGLKSSPNLEMQTKCCWLDGIKLKKTLSALKGVCSMLREYSLKLKTLNPKMVSKAHVAKCVILWNKFIS